MKTVSDRHIKMSKWEPYPGYRDSGIDWLGKIPRHWKILPLKTIAPFVSRGNSPEYVEEKGIPVINQACIYWEGLDYKKIKFQKQTDVTDWKGKIENGDLLMNSTGTGTLGRASIFNGIGHYIADSHVTIVRFDSSKVIVKYIYYLLRTPIYQGHIYAALVSGSTNQVELNKEGLRRTLFLSPPITEQLIIADFLDNRTTKINSLIEKKEKLIQILEEKRSALISHVVTKGLDPNVPMKDSGVDWLGEIPAHWKILPLKTIAPFVSRGNSPEYVEENGIPVINQACIYWEGLDYKNIKFQKQTDVTNWKGRLENGDLLINSTGTGTLGRASIFNGLGSYVADSHVTIVRFDSSKANVKYNYYLIRTPIYQGYIYADLVSGSTNQVELNREKLRSTQILSPPITEQKVIADFLERETTKLDNLILKIQQAIEILKEYRSALITAAITGKIDVRGDAT